MTCRRQKGVCGCKDAVRNAMQKEGRVRGCKDAWRNDMQKEGRVRGCKDAVHNDRQKAGGVRGTRRQKSGSPPWGASGSCYTSRLPAGMLPSSITKCSCSPRSADRSIPQLSCPIIFRGARLVTATRVLPTSSSGV